MRLNLLGIEAQDACKDRPRSSFRQKLEPRLQGSGQGALELHIMAFNSDLPAHPRYYSQPSTPEAFNPPVTRLAAVQRTWSQRGI